MSTVPSNPLQKFSHQPQKKKSPAQKRKTVYLRFIDFFSSSEDRVARFNSTGGMPQKDWPSSTKIGAGIGATTSSSILSSRLLLTMAFLRTAIEEMETDFFEAPFFLLGSLFS
jgi:hypothetical protein